jgi:hypothetical protein
MCSTSIKSIEISVGNCCDYQHHYLFCDINSIDKMISVYLQYLLSVITNFIKNIL